MEYASINEDTNKVTVINSIGLKYKRINLDCLQPNMLKWYRADQYERYSNNITNLVQTIQNKLDYLNIKCSPYPYKIPRYRDDAGPFGPENMIGYLAFLLGYPRKEIKGKSIYYYIQSTTGWSLKFITELGNIKWPLKVIERIKIEYPDLFSDISVY